MNSTPKLGIVVALEREISSLAGGWEQKTLFGSGVEWSVRESEKAVLILVGTGYRRAYAGTKVLIESARPEMVTSIGFAGATAPRLAVGDIFVPAEVVRYRDGARYRSECGHGVLATVENVATPEVKSELAANLGVSAVDMEAAGVAQAAQEAGRRFVAVKAISDAQADNLDLVTKFVQPEGFQTGRFVRHIAVRPHLWQAVARLALNSSVASRALARSAADFVSDVDAFVERAREQCSSRDPE